MLRCILRFLDFRQGVAEEMLRHFARNERNGRLVVRQRASVSGSFAPGSAWLTEENKHLGTVIVGREVDASVASDVGRIAFCQVAFRYGGELVVSSLQAMDERALADRASKFAGAKQYSDWEGTLSRKHGGLDAGIVSASHANGAEVLR